MEDISVLGRLGKGDVGRDGGSCDGGGGVDIVHASTKLTRSRVQLNKLNMG